MKRLQCAAVAVALLGTTAILVAQTKQEGQQPPTKSTKLPFALESGQKLAFEVTMRGMPDTGPVTDASKATEGENVAKAKEKSGDCTLNVMFDVKEKTATGTTLAIVAKKRGIDSSARGTEGKTDTGSMDEECRFTVVVNQYGVIQSFEKDAQPSDTGATSKQPVATAEDKEKEEHARCLVATILGSGLHETALVTDKTYEIGKGTAAPMRKESSGAADEEHPELFPLTLQFTGESEKMARFDIVAVADHKATGGGQSDKSKQDQPGSAKAAGKSAGQAAYSLQDGVIESLNCRCDGAAKEGGTSSSGEFSMTIRRASAVGR
jgi:hypothetical protein